MVNNNNYSFHDGNWISIHRVSKLPLALHHHSNSWILYYFVYMCPQMHRSLWSSSTIFHVVTNNSNLFPCLEIIGIFNFCADAHIWKKFTQRYFYTKILGHKNFWLFGSQYTVAAAKEGQGGHLPPKNERGGGPHPPPPKIEPWYTCNVHR